MTTSYSRSRRGYAAAIFFTAVLAGLTGCGDDSKAKESTRDSEVTVVGSASTDEPSEGDAASGAPSDDAVDSYFEALASRNPDDVEEAFEVAADGTYAEAALIHIRAVLDSLLGAGYSPDDFAADLDNTDDGYRICDDPDDEDSCTEYTGIEGENGKITSYLVNGKDKTSSLVLGSGVKLRAGNLGSVTLRSATEGRDNRLTVVIDIASGGSPLSIGAYTASYRTPEGRQIEASQESILGSTDLQADSLVTAALVFNGAAVGGKVTIELSTADFERQESVTIPLS